MTISDWFPTNNAATNWRFRLPFPPHRDMCINLDGEGETMKAFNFALATALVGAAVQSTPAVASDNTWACEVVLCISNPGGPTQYPACVPPITKLWRVLALGGSFPTCTGGGIAKTKYKKPDDGRPGRLTVTWTDGRQQTYYQPRN